MMINKTHSILLKYFSGLVVLVMMIGLVKSDDKNNTYNHYRYYDEKPDAFNEFFSLITIPIGESQSGYLPSYRFKETEKLNTRRSVLKNFSDTLIFVPRGPYNVGGRTRCLIVDPDDVTGNTWFTGTAGSGIWKTTDAGKTWKDMTKKLPNLATVALCMAPSNHNVIYAGTGEGFGGVGMITGDGIFKSADRGESWTLLESTVRDDFHYINKIWIDPADENILMVATNRGLFRTVNGGEHWESVFSNAFRVQDIVQNPLNANVLYAGVNSFGVIKSCDRGVSWEPMNNGIGGALRISLAVSPADTSYVFASVETPESDLDVYISTDGGENWRKNGRDEQFINFHREQGWYNNAIAADPFIREKVFVAGVHLGTFLFGDSIYESNPTVIRVDTSETANFIDFINFGAPFLGGGMSTGFEENTNVTEIDFSTVELRFGQGKHQKAHRFSVPEGEGPGVPKKDYAYNDYVKFLLRFGI